MAMSDRNSVRSGEEQAVITTAEPTVFDVSPVPPATSALPEVTYKAGVEALLNKPPSQLPDESQGLASASTRAVEACSQYHGKLVANVHLHPVMAAIHLAYKDHRPLVLSPDIVWLLVAQGFANHVNANAEELRPRLVPHSGSATIIVRRDEFIKGSPENPWPEVFDEFTASILEYLGEATHDLLLPSFSTTGPTETAATQVVLLDAMQSYFSYEFHTLCGIPQIVLEGAVSDWEMLAQRTRSLAEFGLTWWTETLAPLLDEFVEAAKGHVNVPFWQSLYKRNNGSGGPHISGWIVAFFPYLKDAQSGRATKKNTWLANGGVALQELLHPPSSFERHLPRIVLPTLEAFPAGLARAPFVWNYLGLSYPMEFLGGFVGVRQEPDTLRLRPEIGWAVREHSGY